MIADMIPTTFSLKQFWLECQMLSPMSALTNTGVSGNHSQVTASSITLITEPLLLTKILINLNEWQSPGDGRPAAGWVETSVLFFCDL